MKKTNTCLSLFVFFLTFVLFVFMIGCKEKSDSSIDSEIGIKKKEEVVIAQWGQEKYLIYLPFYVAMEKGFFSEEGLNVEIRYSGNDDQVFATVLRGSAQFGVGDPVFTAIANERGGELGKVIASIVDGVAIWGVTNNSNIPKIESKEQLSGLRIGTFPSPSTNYTLMNETIISGGESLSNTKIVQAAIGAQIALLESNDADIAMVLEPATSIAESQGYRIVFSSPEFYGPFAFTGLTTSIDYLRSNSDVVQSMVNGIQRALVYCHENINDTIEIAIQLFPDLSREIVENAVNRMLAEETFPTSALVSEKSWGEALRIRKIVGDLKYLQDYEEAVDSKFAGNAIEKYSLNK